MTAPAIERPDRARVDILPPRRRRRLVRILGIVVLLSLLAAIVWLVWFSAVLSVSAVRVVGVSGDRAATVQQAAGIPTGIPLARVDTDAAHRRLLALPWVRTADVRRGWPSEIVIAITAREPIAVVVDDDGKRSAVDAEGISFPPSDAMPKGLPTVTAVDDSLVAAMAVLSSLPADLTRRVVSLDATTLDDVTLTLRSGDKVRWGSAEQPEFKAEVLRALMNRKADVYDVTAPELPTTFRARS